MYENIIVIPYRNRKEHLNYFIQNTWKLLLNKFKNIKLVIVEQEEGKLFNRGKLLNVGFNEYLDDTNYFIMHDVDTNPNETMIDTYYNNNEYDVVRIYCAHDNSLGGVCKISNDTVKTVNGLPNYIWGWGIEDRVLYYRCKIMDINISPFNKNKHNFTMLYHKSNVVYYKGEKLKISELENEIYNSDNKDKQLNHIMSSGLNNLEYTVLDKQIIEDNIEWIKVSI